MAGGRQQAAGRQKAGSRQAAGRQAEDRRKAGRLERVPAYRHPHITQRPETVGSQQRGGVFRWRRAPLAACSGSLAASVLSVLSIREERIERTTLLFESLKSIEILKASQTVKRSHTLKLFLLIVIFSDCGNLRRISAACACVLPALASKIASIFLFVIVINAPTGLKKQLVICLQV